MLVLRRRREKLFLESNAPAWRRRLLWALMTLSQHPDAFESTTTRRPNTCTYHEGPFWHKSRLISGREPHTVREQSSVRTKQALII